jgi:Rho termination factor, N-terminal domain
MPQPVQLFPAKVRAYSDVFGSREKVAYFIGRPDSTYLKCYGLSERETIELLTNLPEELLEVVKKHYHLIPDPNHAPSLMDKETKETAVEAETVEEFIEAHEKAEEVDLHEFSRNELRELAKELGVKGYADMKKDDLVQAIEEAMKQLDQQAAQEQAEAAEGEE